MVGGEGHTVLLRFSVSAQERVCVQRLEWLASSVWSGRQWSLELQLMCVALCGWSLLLLAYLTLFLTTFVSQGNNCSSLCTVFIYSWYNFHLSFKKCSCLGKILIRVTDCLFPSMCQQKAPTLSRFLLMWLPAPVHTMVLKSSSQLVSPGQMILPSVFSYLSDAPEGCLSSKRCFYFWGHLESNSQKQFL